MSAMQLRIRIRDPYPGQQKAIEVLDQDGNVLGDLALSVGDVEYKMGMGAMSVVVITLAVERAHIDTLETPSNTSGKLEAVS